MKGLVAFLLLGIGVLIFLGYQGYKQSQLFDRWTADCLKMGGVTVEFSTRSECVIDSQIVTVPGYEGF